jgi:hypothetical protein
MFPPAKLGFFGNWGYASARRRNPPPRRRRNSTVARKFRGDYSRAKILLEPQAMKGRSPKPTALHKLQGTLHARHKRSRANEPMPEGDLGRYAPPGLTPAQADGWRYAVDHMPAGVLKMVDRGLLLVWVEAEDRHRTAMAMQAKLDASSELKLLIKTPSGLVSSPYVRILDRTAKTMLRRCRNWASRQRAGRGSRRRPSPTRPIRQIRGRCCG